MAFSQSLSIFAVYEVAVAIRCVTWIAGQKLNKAVLSCCRWFSISSTTAKAWRSCCIFRYLVLVRSLPAAVNGFMRSEFVCNLKSSPLIHRAQCYYWPPGQESRTVRPHSTGRIPYRYAVRNHGNHADVDAQRSAGRFLLTLLGQ